MDLNAPLGMRPPPKAPRRLMPIVAGALAVVAVGGLVFALATADPRGGEPYAVTTIPPKLHAAAPSPPDPMPTGSLAVRPMPTEPGQSPPVDVASLEGGVKVHRGSAEPTGEARQAPGPLVIDVSKALDEPARQKASAPGAGPRLVTGATTPAGSRPRIAMFVSGMGLSATVTRTATEQMPPAVDLAFVPYGETVGAAVVAAKARGHEILLQVPMEAAQGQRPGPHALRPDEPPQQIADDLGWLMGRIGGYAGLVNLLGGPVTSNASTMTALLKTAQAHGLFYVDDGTSARSLGPSLSSGLGLPALQADVVLDATGDPAVVRANLDRLVTIARSKGQAIGMASGLPDHLGAIARFAAELDGKGISLVPVGVLAGRSANVATTR